MFPHVVFKHAGVIISVKYLLDGIIGIEFICSLNEQSIMWFDKSCCLIVVLSFDTYTIENKAKTVWSVFFRIIYNTLLLIVQHMCTSIY